jgi:hypothetical protein
MEEVEFCAIVLAESTEDGRRLVEWAVSADGGNAPLLEAVFSLMWRNHEAR